MPSAASDLADFAPRVAHATEQALAAWLADRAREASRLGADVAAHVEAVRTLSLRGGKRLRPVLTALAFEGFAGSAFAPITPALIALELFQSYLLVHDDWMDGDAVRRGGPTVHVALGERFGSSSQGATAAVLAGDLASALAHEALGETPVGAPALTAAFRELAAMHRAVVLGQILDVRGVCDSVSSVERMHDLKTGSYTVRGPLRLGAALAGADETSRDALEPFVRPLGVAFQLADDLLGVFGDPAVTGKPVGADLREGKRTAVTLLLEGAAGQGEPGAIERRVAAARAAGVEARVGARIEELEREARAALALVPVAASARARLDAVVTLLTRRDR